MRNKAKGDEDVACKKTENIVNKTKNISSKNDKESEYTDARMTNKQYPTVYNKLHDPMENKNAVTEEEWSNQ
jgi:hypothetical protein